MRKLFHQICTPVLVLGFLLGIYEGRVTLWQDNDPRPVQIYDIRESSLPPADRLLLRRGIRAGTKEELWLILENFMD